MKDRVPQLTLPKHQRKRSHSSESDSSETSSDSDSSVHVSKVVKPSPERIEISSDSDTALVEVRNSEKRKKHKHSDMENIHIIHDGKRHRHKCHHHHHRHHHRHHKLITSREREEKAHRKTCSKYKATQDVSLVRVKEEPESDDDRARHSHSSHRRPVKRRKRSDDDEFTRSDQHAATSTRTSDRRERSYYRRDGSNEQTSNERHAERRKNNEGEKAKDGPSKPEERKNNRPGRRNRWGNDDDRDDILNNRPIEVKYEWGKKSDVKEERKSPSNQKDKPNFGLSGKLTEDTNMYNGVVIKYSEPPEARKPKRRWRFYPFKGDQGLPTLYIHRQSCYLIGRDRKVADIPVDHPSCSKQHAALQYRLVPFTREDGSVGKRVRPYIIDLESANGTYVNSVKIEPRTYVELLEKDVIKFGYSSREIRSPS
ncbi:hypothetical protein L9F63_021822 [Diploptera punctata]|uniref:FHA domain-containing protein n=1 Tax=Diploptera punctata TaxID=6984 RepID=A0AAD7ZN43_DIPPU|nr:hypothetical protein L9F63_021822 [Diploptera punctata]